MADTKTGAPAATSEGKPAADTKTTDTKTTETTGEKTADGTAAPEGETSKEPARKDGEAKPEPKAPEKYELKVPEGINVIAPRDLELIERVARESNFSNEDAQALLDEQVAIAERQSTEYFDELKADKEYGGDKLTETKRLADRVLNRVRPEGHARRDAFFRFLNRGGSGNNVEVVAFLADLGKMMGEDSPSFQGGGGSGGKKSDAELFYDKTPAT